MSAQRTERLLNLVIALLATRRWLTKEQLRQAVPQYAAARSDEAFDRMFERDKDDLRELGIPVRTGSHDPLFDDEPGYRVDAEDYALPGMQVTDAELATLGLAAQVWQQANLAGPATRALAKLSALGVPVGPAQQPAAARLATEEPFFDAIYAAATDAAPVSFGYLKEGAAAPEQRTVEPWRLRLWHGRWYLHGYDRDRGGDRVFRLSRVRAPVRRAGPDGTVQRPDGVDSRAAIERVWGPARERTAVVDLDPGSGVALRARAGAGPDDPRIRLQVRDLDDLAGQIAALGGHAHPVEPPELVGAVRDLLTNALAAHTGPPVPVPDDLRAPAPNRTPATGATERLSRLLALVPYLVAHRGLRVAEVAAQFRISEAQLVKDLQLLFVCGTPGHLPDDLIEADWESGRIYLDNAETIARPLRLTMDEATALLVGLRALSEVPGATANPALESATAKLTEAAGAAGAAAQALSISLDDDSDPQVRALAEQAVSTRRRLHLRYLVPGRDEATERDVDPIRVVNLSGAWYLQGWCLRADAVRTFRLSRVLDARLTDVPVDEHTAADPVDLDSMTPTSPRDLVVLVGLDARHRWVAEQYRPEAVHEDGSGLQARIRVWDPASIRQLALRSGGGLRVLSPGWLAEEVAGQARAALSVTDGDG